MKEGKGMKDKTIREIRQMLAEEEVTTEMVSQLKKDKRKGVQTLVRSYERKQAVSIAQKQHFQQLLAFDQSYRHNSRQKIAGVDEAGRGPLAGPVVAAAVILPRRFSLVGLNDSKQLSQAQRESFYEQIIREAESYAISIIDNRQIDQLNIYQATKKAMIDALIQLDVQPDLALIDAMKIDRLPYETYAIVKGDETSLSIAAASILAKVTRDKLMCEIDEVYPAYQFKSNKGYGTKEHLDAVELNGITPYHRLTFAPITKMSEK